MIEVIRRHIPAFFVLCLLQILILNNIQFGGFINPYLYVLFLISLPFDTSPIVLMIMGFILGFTIDIFARTIGIHISACVLLAYARGPVYRLFAPRDGYDPSLNPSAGSMGWPWILSVASILVVMHHTTLLFLEEFRLTNFFSTVGRVLLGSVFTMIMIVLAELFTYRAKSR